jgi:gas vesicle protein
MTNNNGIGPGSLMTAFVFGALAGAAVALLVTPATGDDAREYLGKRAREGREQTGDAVRQSREALNRQRDNLTSTFEKVRETYRNAREEQQGQEPVS